MLSPDKIQSEVLGYLERRFGLAPENFKEHRFYLASRERLYLGPKRVPDDRRIATLGILVARASSSIKPTTNLFQLFGDRITRNFLALDAKQAAAFARGEDLQIGDTGGATDGYVLLRYLDIPLGCGLLRGKGVKNMLPKAKRLEVLHL